jgi:hypothetical protein
MFANTSSSSSNSWNCGAAAIGAVVRSASASLGDGASAIGVVVGAALLVSTLFSGAARTNAAVVGAPHPHVQPRLARSMYLF